MKTAVQITTLFILLNAWFNPVPNAQAKEISFSVVLLPDIQYYTASYPATLTTQIQWIIDQRQTINIVYVAGLGDITNLGDANPQEWTNAWQAIQMLESAELTGLPEGIPYGLAVGNHDQMPQNDLEKPALGYNKYFGIEHFAGRSYYGGSYTPIDSANPPDNDSHYDLFSAGGLDFIVIYLEYGAYADSARLAWAARLLRTYPQRLGIVISHAILQGNGYFNIEGQTVYDALKTNPNLILMLSGHDWAEAHRTDIYNGRVVYTLTADYSHCPYGGAGWLQYLTFFPQTNRVQVHTYSPTLARHKHGDTSQFELAVDLGQVPFDLSAHTLNPAQVVASGTSTRVSATVFWEGLRLLFGQGVSSLLETYTLLAGAAHPWISLLIAFQIGQVLVYGYRTRGSYLPILRNLAQWIRA